MAFLWDAFEDAQMMPEPSVSREAGETHTHTHTQRKKSINQEKGKWAHCDVAGLRPNNAALANSCSLTANQHVHGLFGASSTRCPFLVS